MPQFECVVDGCTATVEGTEDEVVEAVEEHVSAEHSDAHQIIEALGLHDEAVENLRKSL